MWPCTVTRVRKWWRVLRKNHISKSFWALPTGEYDSFKSLCTFPYLKISVGRVLHYTDYCHFGLPLSFLKWAYRRSVYPPSEVYSDFALFRTYFCFWSSFVPFWTSPYHSFFRLTFFSPSLLLYFYWYVGLRADEIVWCRGRSASMLSIAFWCFHIFLRLPVLSSRSAVFWAPFAGGGT